jgi:hypothetical protein
MSTTTVADDGCSFELPVPEIRGELPSRTIIRP